MLPRKIRRLERRLEFQKNRYLQTLNRRLLFGLIFLASLIAAAFYPKLVLLRLAAFLISPAAFFFYARRSGRLKRHMRDLESLKDFYRRQLDRQNGAAPVISPKPLATPPSPLINDLDLFAPHSLFHQIDETFTSRGQSRLVEWMLAQQTDAGEIRRRQKRVGALAAHHWPLTRLVLLGRGMSDLLSSQSHLEDFVQRPFLEDSFARDYKILMGLFALSVAGIVQYVFLEFWSPAIFISLHFFYFLYASAQLKLSLTRANDLSIHLGQLIPIFRKLETAAFAKLEDDILSNTRKLAPTARLKSINFIASALSIQAHPVVYLAINAFLPWSFFFTARLDRQRRKIAEVIQPCLDELATLEALTSLALLYRYQTRTFPALAEKPDFQARGMYHPLINRKHVVKNDFVLKKDGRLNLITGSNMAGKSTFLRTIGINQVLLQMGAPVFADSYVSFPFRLATSIRVSDSLESGFSYFYSEVLRLKEILEGSRRTEPLLYLIDEIFRGTNNRERLEGSRALLSELAKTGGIGFVSTHDLELTHLAENNPRIVNYHFRDDISDHELVFSYKIHEGPCPTTNALKIMAKAGLPI